MSNVSKHLRIVHEEYDERIRTFVPHYEQMLDIVAQEVDRRCGDAPKILDLGVGTGALSERCLKVRPKARLCGLDADEEMIATARVRLKGSTSVEFRLGNFEETYLPMSDVIVASLSLHHIPTAQRKRMLYKRCFDLLPPSGMILNADCFPDSDSGRAEAQKAFWLGHLERTYSPAEARGYLDAWASEDTYMAIDDEQLWLKEAGFEVSVLWREDGFGVLRGVKKT